MVENSEFDKKSLRLVQGKTADWSELAKDCVGFANGLGGVIHIGIEDKDTEPLSSQKIPDALIEKINKTIPEKTVGVAIFATKEVAPNGGEYIILKVLRSAQTIASTTDGKYYIRIADNCKPIMPDELTRIASEKQAFVWEEKIVRKIPSSNSDKLKLSTFLDDIQSSDRVSAFIKEMPYNDLLEYYFLSKDDILTNLGVLWIGDRKDRANMHYAPSV